MRYSIISTDILKRRIMILDILETVVSSEAYSKSNVLSLRTSTCMYLLS